MMAMKMTTIMTAGAAAAATMTTTKWQFTIQ